jgi:rhamnosyltransferase
MGVDTWKGDAQAGLYGEEVLRELKEHHDGLYGSFSKLVVGRFEEAAKGVKEGAVDLLHIDGMHGYEAVRGDFEKWLPKMSSRGVMLLHDTQERGEGFGVWRLWQEIAKRYRHFEFTHGHGLGVVGVGEELGVFGEFLEWGERDPEGVRSLFGTLGARMELRRGVRDKLPAIGMRKRAAEVLRGMEGDESLRRELMDLVERPRSVSVVVPTQNGGERFGKLLEGVKGQVFNGWLEMVVVDSGSGDRTAEWARGMGARVTEIMPEEFNHGMTRNRGIRESGGEIVILLTQDAVPAPGLVAAMVKNFEDERVAGVVGRQMAREEHGALVGWRVCEWATGREERRVAEITDREACEGMTAREKHWLCVFDNVCAALRRSVWEEMPFEASDFGEDLAWGKRVLEAGWRIVYDPEARVEHSHNRSPRYEYRRTYMGHAMLLKLFGMEGMRRERVGPEMMREMIRDWGVVWREEPGVGRKIWWMMKVPVLACARVLGAYHGGRDAKAGRVVRQEGI